ncbi:MAG: cytochrome c [Gammaproteobacteria bacterium]|nr:cytochrome c [Gammaproteobacteria bacterium]
MKTNVFLILCIAIASPYAIADQNTKQPKQADLIKYRQSAMMFMRWNISKLKNQLVTNPESYNKEDVIKASAAIAAIANSDLNKLFPASSQTGTGWKKTRVKATYFTQTDKVNKHTFALIKESNQLLEAANGGDMTAIRYQFDRVFKSCKSCHKAYRLKN